MSYPSDTPDLKQAADHDESPPLTPTGNAPSSESELDISSPNASHDESQSKDQANRDSDKDLSHRPKRRRCHETYNFNMKCPTPGCNSLGKYSVFCRCCTWACQSYLCFLFIFCKLLYHHMNNLLLLLIRSPHRETWTSFCCIRVPTLPQPFCWWMQGILECIPEP